MAQYILACDEGTSSARTVLFDLAGHEFTSSQRALTSYFPQEGWVEQDALEIWHQQLETIQAVLTDSQITQESIKALGITNQRETVVVWDRKTHQPIAPAITWQCRRTQPMCEKIQTDIDKAQWLTSTTGLKIDPYFSATKLRWLLDTVTDAQSRAEQGELAFGTIDGWLIYQLTGGETHVIDRTNASRTMLMNLEKGEWDQDILEYFNIPKNMLPKICGSAEVVGYTSGDVLGAQIPIAGIAGDQQAAMVGQGCTQINSAKLTYGTGAFLLVHTGENVVHSDTGLLTTAVASTNKFPEFALEGSVFSAGSAVQWLRDQLNLIQSAEETESIALSVDSSNGVHLVPAFEGLGAPYWSADARGILTGLTRGVDRRHIVRATLESIAFQVYDLIDAFRQDTKSELKELRVDGGAAANNFLLQFQADLLGIPVIRPQSLESTVRGAAILSISALGEDSAWGYETDRVFEPNIELSDREVRLEGWHTAITQALAGRN